MRALEELILLDAHAASGVGVLGHRVAEGVGHRGLDQGGGAIDDIIGRGRGVAVAVHDAHDAAQTIHDRPARLAGGVDRHHGTAGGVDAQTEATEVGSHALRIGCVRQAEAVGKIVIIPHNGGQAEARRDAVLTSDRRVVGIDATQGSEPLRPRHLTVPHVIGHGGLGQRLGVVGVLVAAARRGDAGTPGHGLVGGIAVVGIVEEARSEERPGRIGHRRIHLGIDARAADLPDGGREGVALVRRGGDAAIVVIGVRHRSQVSGNSGIGRPRLQQVAMRVGHHHVGLLIASLSAETK